MGTKAKSVPRGIRNNNPGNIEKGKDKWQGLAAEQLDSRFATFRDPTYGIRAIARIIIKYQDDYNLNTVTKIINRWAPPSENNTNSYIRAVCADIGCTPNEKIDVFEFDVMYPLVVGIIEHENGYNPYTKAQITKGLVLAGVEPMHEKEKPISKSREVNAATVAGGATGLSLMADTIEKVSPAMPLMETLALYAPYALGAIVFAAIGYIVWIKIDDRRKGLR